MSTFALWRLFHRPGRSDTTAHTSALAIIAFAAATAIFLTVLGGLHGFVWRASADHTIGCLFSPDACAPGTYEAFSRRLADDQMTQMASTYVVLAIFACVLLVVPFAALAGSAARLAASRRDTRLAALRLAGATTGQVVRLTALDAAGQALIGSLIGIIGYFAIMPLIMLLNFQNQRFTFEQLWVGSIALVAVVAGVTVLALVSALITLRRVAITPLGVMSRAAEPLPAKWRVLIFLAVVAAAYLVFSNPTMLTGLGDAMIYAVVIGFFFLVFAVVNLVGAWVVAARARVKARHPKDAATMIAMRRILDNPKRAWRNVSGVALAVFVARHHLDLRIPVDQRVDLGRRRAAGRRSGRDDDARHRHRRSADAGIRRRAGRGQLRCDAGGLGVRPGGRIPDAGVGRHRREDVEPCAVQGGADAADHRGCGGGRLLAAAHVPAVRGLDDAAGHDPELRRRRGAVLRAGVGGLRSRPTAWPPA